MWLGQSKPRRFEHRMIYADDRKRLAGELKKRAGEECSREEAARDFHFSFADGRHRNGRSRAGNGANLLFFVVVLAAMLIAVLYALS